MNLINTTVFRLSLRFAAMFVLIFIIAITSLYFRTFVEIEEQTDIELSLELHEIEIFHHVEDDKALTDRVNDRERYGEHIGHYYALLNSNKEYLAGNTNLALLMKPVVKNNSTVSYIETETDNYKEHAVLRIAYKMLEDEGYLIVAQENTSLYELREHTYSAIIFAVIITVFLGLIIGIYMGRLVLCQINKINDGMNDAIASNFKQTIPLPENNDEFQALTLKLNQMLERIETLISAMRQVTDNIAHDLRSPLNRMRSRLEVTLLQSRSEQEYQDVMAQAVNDCDHLLQTFNSLLSIAQAEAGVRGNNWEKVDLVSLVSHLVELYQVVAEEKKQTFNWQHTSTAETEVTGNKELLTQAVSNLIENAIKYSEENGKISIEVCNDAGHPTIRITDNGPGIPKKHREKVLERFQRLDSSRSSPGNGLGLSLVNAVTKLHNAKLQLSDNQPGLKVELVF